MAVAKVLMFLSYHIAFLRQSSSIPDLVKNEQGYDFKASGELDRESIFLFIF